MLVLHPSSRCDVCLEPYAQDSFARSPHSVPCGHVFCRTCLLAIIPPNCPLCRKPYLPDRVKKLVVDKLEDVDEQLQGDSRRENELLRRLMVCWDESDERLGDLTREVDLWLEGRTESHPALKKARTALAEYQRLKTRRERDRVTIKALKERERVTSFERDETQAIEESLLSQLSQLETKLAEAEADKQELQTQVAKYKLKNPLPHPPEIPVPLNQLTISVPTPRASSSRSLYSVPEAGPSNSRRQSQINGSTMQRDSRLLTPYYAPNSAFQTQPVHSDFGDKKGKRRARETNGRHSSASVYTNAHSFLSNSHPNVVLSDDEASVILPGAVTQRRVIPPKEVTASNTPFPRTPGDTDIAPGSGSGSAGGPSGFDVNASMMPYSVAALYIGEYLNGYGDGFSTVASGLDPNGQPAPSAGRIEPSGQHGWGGTAQDATPRTSWRREIAASPSQSGSQQHYTGHGSSARPSAAEQGNDSSEERLVYHVNGPRERLGTTSSNASNVDSDSNYADGHVTDSSFHSKSRNNANEGPSQFRARQHRRRAPIPPGHETDVESARRTRDDYRVPPTLRPSSVSVSSWSIHPPAATTAATIAVGQASMTRSQNELGLTSFGPASMYPSPPQDTPRSTLSVLGLHSFPLREDDEIVMERLPSVSASVGHGPSTPTTQQPRQRGERRVSFDHRPTIIVGAGASVQSLGQGQATTATSAVSAIATTAMASMSVNESSSSSRNLQRRSGRQGYPHGRSNTSASARSSSASVQSNTMHPPPMILDTTIAMEDAVHLAAAEMPRPLPRTPPRLRNALGLQLEDNTTGASGGISAPTPIVSAETFLRSWSNGE